MLDGREREIFCFICQESVDVVGFFVCLYCVCVCVFKVKIEFTASESNIKIHEMCQTPDSLNQFS